MPFYQGRTYLDDRLFILDLTQAKKNGRTIWAVITRRNCEGFPPFRSDECETKEEAVAFIDKIEPQTQRFSLGEKSPVPTPSYIDYCRWLRSHGLPSSIQFSEMNKRNPDQVVIADVKQ
jgi:hypothetical protein